MSTAAVLWTDYERDPMGDTYDSGYLDDDSSDVCRCRVRNIPRVSALAPVLAGSARPRSMCERIRTASGSVCQ